MTPAFRVDGLVKQYRRTRALDGLSLTVPQGSIFALVGSNGAGKTTLMSIVSGLVKPDRGACDVLGHGPYSAARHAGLVAILPQDSVPPRHARIDHLLHYYARLQGLHRAPARAAVREVLGWVNLADKTTARVSELSHGMLRRFTIAQAFLGNPEIVLLDEPMSGLDPVEAANIRNLIRSRRGRQTIVISSHILHELESVCDQVAFIEAGRLMRQNSMKHVTRHGRQINMNITGTPPLARLQELVPEHAVEFDAAAQMLRIHLTGQPTALGSINGLIIPALLDAGCQIIEIVLGSNLEHEYLNQRQAR
ncbi:ABC transporter ATP-binding protein [Pontiella sp.]|uniref:ABC transporter ATP-binding protein n=1 Tax=Pontiella sp. TaxID=2837462 RepID=UPI003562C41C